MSKYRGIGKRRFWGCAMTVSVLVVTAGCLTGDSRSTSSVGADLGFPVAQVRFSNSAQTTVDVYVADDLVEQSLGLGDMEMLAMDQGMLFLFDASERYTFWMKDVEYPIDIIWLNDGEVVDISAQAQPEPTDISESHYQRYQPDQLANQVLEVNSGFAAQNDIQVGQNITILYYQ